MAFQPIVDVETETVFAYEALVRAIAHQQVHGRAAEAILGRFLALFPDHAFPPPELVLATPPEAVRACGFSGAKLAAIRDIAEEVGARPERLLMVDYQQRTADDDDMPSLSDVFAAYGSWKLV